METRELIDQVLKLDPSERIALVDEVVLSLDEPDGEIDQLWAEEAQRRLLAYRAGQMPTVPAEDLLGPL